jgi:CBS domain-containing protein
VLGVGYDTIHELLRGEMIGPALFGLLIGKALVWSIALGSGTSGGVLAPLLMMGGALGAIVAPLIPLGDSGLWALIGMAAMMGGTMRSPLTAMVFAVELTQDFNLLPGLLVGCIAAHGVTVLLLRRSILTEKVARRGFHIMREYSVDPFTMVRVGEVMERNVPTVPASMRLIDLSDRIAAHDPRVARHAGLLIVDEEKELAGVITRGDVLRTIEQDDQNDNTVLDAGSRDPVVTFADEVLYDAAAKMLRHNIGRLPVVSRVNPRRIVGYLGRSNLMAAHRRQLEEEHVRDRKFFDNRLGGSDSLR